MGKKKQIFKQLVIDSISSDGLGIAKSDSDRVIFVNQAIPGDTVDVEEIKRRKKYRTASIIKMISPSDDRATPFCKHFGTCGGCKWQHIEYSKQVEYKAQIVRDAMERIGKVSVKRILPPISANPDRQYRNKLEYTFSNRRWLTQEEIASEQSFENRNALGFHVPGNYSRVVDIQTCWLQENISNTIRNAVRDFAEKEHISFYDIIEQSGCLRNLIIRTSSLGELMVIVILGEHHDETIKKLSTFLRAQFAQINSLHFIINTKRNDSYADLPTICVYGKPYIHEQIGDYTYRVHPKSFFQTNSFQVKHLYDAIKNMAGIKKSDVVYDLYCGVGSIGIYLSREAKKIVAVEQIPEAIEDARENAGINDVTNISFHTGDVKLLFNSSFIQENGAPDVIVIDPPRSGMHPDVINSTLSIQASKIVYVSCNPATQARDLALLSSRYQIEKMQPVDMFPHTTHIENVALLMLKK